MLRAKQDPADPDTSIVYDDGRPSLGMVDSRPETEESSGALAWQRANELEATLQKALDWYDCTASANPISTGQPLWVFEAGALGLKSEAESPQVMLLLGPDDKIVMESLSADVHASWGLGVAQRDGETYKNLHVIRHYDETRA